MIEQIKKFFKDCLTEANNETYEIGRTLWAVAFVIGLVLEIISVFYKINFNLQQYGIGIGALLTAGGLVNALKSNVEIGKLNKDATQ